MDNFSRWLLALGAGGLLAALGTGCHRAETAVERGNREGILLLGNGAEPADLDPDIITGTKENNIIRALFEGMTATDPTTGRPQPALAERWDISPDGRVYTFHLRPGVKWSNGDPLTAGDFVYAYERVLNPLLGGEFSFYLWIIQGARDYNQKRTADFSQVGVRAPDERTLEITLENPAPYLLDLMSFAPFMPVPKKAIQAAGGQTRRGTEWTRPGRLVSSGPFQLEEWTVNKVVGLKKNPNYWDAGRVRLNGIKFFPTENIESEERAFRAGQLHKTYDVPFAKIEPYRREHPDLLRIDPYVRTQYLCLNCRRPPLDRPEVRRALGLAVDREAIVRNITRGGEKAAYSLTSPGLPGYTARAHQPFDPAAARALLAQAGFPGGKGMPNLELIFNTSEANRVIAEAIQQMWKQELGVNAVLANQEWKVYLNRRTQQDYQVFEGGWTTSYLDPTGFLELFVGGSIINQAGWADTRFDRALEDGARTLDPAGRFEHIQQAEEILMDQAPLIPIFHYNRVYLMSPAVQGWVPNLIDDHPYKYLSLKQ